MAAVQIVTLSFADWAPPPYVAARRAACDACPHQRLREDDAAACPFPPPRGLSPCKLSESIRNSLARCPAPQPRWGPADIDTGRADPAGLL